MFWIFQSFLHLLQSEDIEVESDGEQDKEVDPELLEWEEAGKIFGLLEGTGEMDEEECRKVVNGIKVFREGITKQMEGFSLQDEGLAIVQEAVANHPLRAFGPLLDAAMVGSRCSQPHPTASIGKHVKHKCCSPTHLPPHSYPGPSTPTNTSTLPTAETATPSSEDIPSSQWKATRINVDGVHKYKCSGCGVVQTMRNAVLSHIRVIHTKTKLGPCCHCGEFISTNNDSY